MKLSRLSLLDKGVRRVPVLVCCPLCDEPLEADGRGGLACGCSRSSVGRRCEHVDSEGERAYALPLALQILAERYGLDGRRPRTLEEVARRHGISRARVRLLEGRVILALRKLLG